MVVAIPISVMIIVVFSVAILTILKKMKSGMSYAKAHIHAYVHECEC